MAEDVFEMDTANFLSWLVQMGVKMSPKASIADLRVEGRGRGMVAMGDFGEEEIIFTIPRNLVLTVEKAISGPGYENPSVRSELVGGPSWLSLTIIMMSEALRNDSPWSPYLAVLPSKLDSLVFWSPSELAELQASAVLAKIGKVEAEEMFCRKVSTLGIDGGTIELFHKMASIIMAYAFDIPKDSIESDLGSDVGEEFVHDDDDGQETVLTLIPLADMLNADANQNNARLIYSAQNLEMRSIKKIKRGEEIYNDYGPLPRLDLLRRYGYAADSYTPYDVVELCTDSIVSAFQEHLLFDADSRPIDHLSETDLEARLDLARRENIYEDSYDVKHASSEGPCIPDELLALVYILLIDIDTLTSLQTSILALPRRSMLAAELVGVIMRRLLQLREREYATSLEEDTEILKVGSLSHRRTMAIKIRLGEKMVLREAIREAASFRGSNGRMQTNNS